MNKFSIIVPVYNVEKYLDKCLNSICNQSYDNFEVIVVNDGTPDNSQEIIDKYIKKDSRFKSYTKSNGGLSDARNFGLNYISGDYLMFVDSDDYLESELLLKLNECVSGNDMIKFKLNIVNENEEIIETRRELENSREITFEELVNGTDLFEPACSYAYNMEFWTKNNFKFEVGKLHEDFGLIPLCAMLANKLYFLDYGGYNYVQREGSITNSNDEKNIKRVYDILFHFDNLTKKAEKFDVDNKNKKILYSYLANSLLSSAKLLEKKDMTKFIEELKKRKIYNYILDDTISRKIKKLLIKVNMKFYIEKRYARS